MALPSRTQSNLDEVQCGGVEGVARLQAARPGQHGASSRNMRAPLP
jgi:hypothetical protein